MLTKRSPHGTRTRSPQGVYNTITPSGPISLTETFSVVDEWTMFKLGELTPTQLAGYIERKWSYSGATVNPVNGALQGGSWGTPVDTWVPSVGTYSTDVVYYNTGGALNINGIPSSGNTSTAIIRRGVVSFTAPRSGILAIKYTISFTGGTSGPQTWNFYLTTPKVSGVPGFVYSGSNVGVLPVVGNYQFNLGPVVAGQTYSLMVGNVNDEAHVFDALAGGQTAFPGQGHISWGPLQPGHIYVEA